MNTYDFPYDYLVIEGNIGAGKTTFCKMLNKEYSSNLILEEFDDNPFLPYFYEDPERFGFTVELFFMTERYKQLEKMLMNQGLFHNMTIADYAFVKTLLFARQNLKDGEYRLFKQMYDTLSNNFPQPNILVYFHRSVDILLVNIAKRGRTYETNISGDYLLKIQNSYFDYLRNILSIPVLIIDLKTLDFESNADHYDHLKYLLSKNYRPGVHRITLSP